MSWEYFEVGGGDIFDRTGGDYGGGLGGGEIGSGVGGTPAPSVTSIQVAEGGKLALAYGRHIVAGHLILDQTSSPETVLQALGEGEWDSLEKVWYKGQELAPTDYNFHPGTPSTGPSDPVQGIDAFFPSGLTYSQTAYVAARVPSPFASDNPHDQLRALCKCLKVYDYDRNGQQIGYGYSANQARIAADLIIKRAGMPPGRIDWPSWAVFKAECDETITWDDGDTVRTIPRFECHVVFLENLPLADALNAVMATCGGVWQDDGEKIIFLGPLQTTPVHHFTVDNVVSGSVNFAVKGITDRPNLARVRFRDLDNEFLSEASVQAARDTLQDEVGIIEAPGKVIPNCNYSQAQRLLERQMRLDTDNPMQLQLQGLGDSFHVLPGDYVWVTLPHVGLGYAKCLVIEASDEPAEKAPDLRSFTLQKIDGELYRDTDHKPVQKPVAVT